MSLRNCYHNYCWNHLVVNKQKNYKKTDYFLLWRSARTAHLCLPIMLCYIHLQAISYMCRLFHTCAGYFIHVQAISYMCRLFHTCAGNFIHVQSISYMCRLFHTCAGNFIHVCAYHVIYMCRLFDSCAGYFIHLQAIS